MSRTKIIAMAMTVMGGLSCAGDALAYTVYVSNEKGNSITVLDSATLEIKQTIPVGQRPRGIMLTKDGAKMIMAVANASVPKFTVICNGSYGAGNYGMSGRAFDPRLLFMWPQSQISVMGAEQAANVLVDIKLRQLARAGETLTPQDIAAIREPLLQDYQDQSSAWFSTSRLWDDGVLDPVDTRQALAIGLSAALNAPIATPSYGVFRM